MAEERNSDGKSSNGQSDSNKKAIEKEVNDFQMN